MNVESQQWFAENGIDPLDPNATNTDGEPALILASRQGRHELIEELLSNGVNVDCVDQYGNNAIWAACYAESEDCIRLLVEYDCQLNYRNPAGNSALAYAASSGKDKVVRLLLDLGADPKLQNQDGMTAMDLATTLPGLKLLRSVS